MSRQHKSDKVSWFTYLRMRLRGDFGPRWWHLPSIWMMKWLCNEDARAFARRAYGRGYDLIFVCRSLEYFFNIPYAEAKHIAFTECPEKDI